MSADRRFIFSLGLICMFFASLQTQAIIPFAFWKNQAQNGWAWMNGFKDEYYTGVFGTQGVAASANFPGERSYGASYWRDSSGNLWLFGGWGVGSDGTFGALADLWKYDVSAGQWTYVKGPKNANSAGVCGTKGTAAAGNYPGGRYNSQTWIDSSGNLWLFGGMGGDCSSGSIVYNNSLWKYDVSSGNWTWISGSSTGGGAGTYGTKGTGSTGNIPGSRQISVGTYNWVDSSGNFWLFGGIGQDSVGANGRLNDLWKFNPSNSQWTWVSGSNTINQNGTYGTKGAGSTSNIPGARLENMGWMDAAGGYLWIFGGYGRDSVGTVDVLNDLWKYEIATGQWTWVGGSNLGGQAGTFGTKGVPSTSNIPGGLMQTRAMLDTSGNVWMVGGCCYDGFGGWGYLNTVWKYNPSTNEWTWISGSKTNSQKATYGTRGVGSTSNVIGSRDNPIAWMDTSNVIRIYSGVGYDKLTNDHTNYLIDLWTFDPSTLQWTWVSGPDASYARPFAGTAGVTDSPGGRSAAATMTDSSGNLWLFGGYGYVEVGWEPFGVKNDLWKYNPTSGVWSKLAGNSFNYVNGVYGTRGTGSTSNIPGSRRDHVGWGDSSGNLWIFGGSGYDSAGSFAAMNDLWKYNIATGQWTWMTGSNTGNHYGTYGTKGTPAAANTPGTRDSMAIAQDSSGNIWLFGGGGMAAASGGYLNDFWKYNPGTNQWTWISGSNAANQNGTYGTKGVASVSNTPGSRTNPVMWADSSGNIWLFGGGGYDSVGGVDILNDLWKYDPVGNTWTWVSGSKTTAASGVYGTLGVANASNVPGARYQGAAWADGSGNLWLFGGSAYDSVGAGGEINDLWKYNIAGNIWTWVAGAKVVNQQGTHSGPMGKFILNDTPGARMKIPAWQDTSGNFWLYGGLGYDASGIRGYRNDFWKYKP